VEAERRIVARQTMNIAVDVQLDAAPPNAANQRWTPENDENGSSLG